MFIHVVLYICSLCQREIFYLEYKNLRSLCLVFGLLLYENDGGEGFREPFIQKIVRDNGQRKAGGMRVLLTEKRGQKHCRRVNEALTQFWT